MSDQSGCVSKGFFLSIMFSVVAFQLNISMITPVLVSISHYFKVEEFYIGLSQTIFFILAGVSSVFLPALSDIFGRKKVLLWILFIMSFGNILSVLAPNILWFYFSRALEGFCGPIVAISLLMIYTHIDDRKQYGLWMGIIAAINTGLAGVDSLIAVFLTHYFSFRAIFILCFCISFVSWFLVRLYCQESKPSKRGAMDLKGIIPFAIGFLCILLPLQFAPQMTSTLVIIFLVLAIVSFTVFYLMENQEKRPIIPTSLFKNAATRNLLLTTLFTMIGIFASVNFIVVSYAQNNIFGFSMTSSQLVWSILMPFSVLGWFIAPVIGRWGPKTGYVRLLQVNLCFSVIIMIFLAKYGFENQWLTILCIALLGIVYSGAVNTILNILGIILSPKENPGILSGINASAFNIGAGLSFVIIPWTQKMFVQKNFHGYANAIVMGCCMLLIAFFYSTKIQDKQ